MINRIKKGIAAALAAAAILAAVGCESGREQTNPDDSPHSRLSPAEGFTQDTEDEGREPPTANTERGEDEFYYTYVTAPPPPPPPPAVTYTLTTAERYGDPQTDGKVLNCYSYNDEFGNFLEMYYLADKPLEGIDVNWRIYPYIEYSIQLDTALLSDYNAETDDKIDMFISDTNYLLKYVDSPYALPISELGITENELQNQYPYTKALATGTDGVLRASGYMVCPEVTAYRRSIAEDVLGVSEPEDVQPFLENWSAFEQTAEKMADKGYLMVSSYADLYYGYINTAAYPIVAPGTTKIFVPDAWMYWVDDTKEYTDEGYNNRADSLWTKIWTDDISGDYVFCYHGPSWLVDYSIKPNAYDTEGDWAVTRGPVNSYWMGYYLLAGANTDNADIVADIMRYYTTDPITMEVFSRGTDTMVNNSVVNIALGNDTAYASEFLGGQNPFDVYNEVAQNIDPETAALQNSKYNILCETFEDEFTDYFNGVITKEHALDNFYNTATTLYPELTY
jgi:hypothetical protein